MKDKIIFIGVGDSGSKAVNELSQEGYNCLAIYSNKNLDNKLGCPRINLMDNHYRPDEYPGFTDNPENVKLLLYENESLIKSYLRLWKKGIINKNEK